MNLKGTLSTLVLIFSIALVAPAQQFKALVFTKTAGFRHQSIPNAVTAMKKMGEKQVFSVYTSEDPRVLAEESLMKYDVLILISTTGTIFDETTRASLQKFVQSGKGVVGVHAAADSEYEWPWYNKMIGGYFLAHPAQQTLRLEVVDQNHPSTWHLPKNWMWTDELYEYKDINPDLNVLIKADESTYKVSKGNGDNHPMAWYHEFEGGRVFYTALGHVDSAWEDDVFLKHLYGGIWYAATGHPFNK